MKKITLVQLTFLILFALVGCDKFSETNAGGTVTVTESKWNDQGYSEEETVYSDIQKGDVISDSSFGTLTVKKMNDDYILIALTEGFVEKTGKGINMNADDLTKIKLGKGESITIASKSFDAGVTITIQYN
ncbi:MAG: hypothetical protein IKL53_11510 [Lachnospiraceae bacterium]|nr:hypothetical protein [Lachnospiraceae bacterium]